MNVNYLYFDVKCLGTQWISTNLMTTKQTLTIATRQSPLALWQANWVKKQLEQRYPLLQVKLHGLTTQADKMLTAPLYKVGGKGLFVKELEAALLDKTADIAVHSMKDMPMHLPSDLCVPVLCERLEARDAWVSNKFASWDDLPPGTIVGTSSLRRQSQLLAIRPSLIVNFLRGNVQTRLAKLDRGEYAGIILAAAGLQRLDLDARIRQFFPDTVMLPAPAQGVIGIECRENDLKTQELLTFLHHAPTSICVTAERAMCRYLGGGCHIPIGAYAEIIGEQVKIRGLIADPAGKLVLHSEKIGLPVDAQQLGEQVAEDLLRQGGDQILATLNNG
jgi:hydroxymethylbilane synthase